MANNVYIDFIARDRTTRTFSGLDRRLDRVETRLNRTTAAFGQFNRVAIGFAALNIGRSFVRGAQEIEILRRGLESTYGSVQLGTARFRELKREAEFPGIDLSNAVRLDNILRTLSVETELSTMLMRGLGNAVALIGGGSAEFRRLSRGIFQTISNARILQEEVNQIVESVPPAARALEEVFGTIRAEGAGGIRAQVGFGRENVIENFIRPLTEALGNQPVAAADTLTNRLENLQTNFKVLSDSLGRTFLPVLGAGIQVLGAFAEGITFVNDNTNNLVGNTAVAGLAVAAFNLVSSRLADTFSITTEQIQSQAQAMDLLRDRTQAINAIGTRFATSGAVTGILSGFSEQDIRRITDIEDAVEAYQEIQRVQQRNIDAENALIQQRRDRGGGLLGGLLGGVALSLAIGGIASLTQRVFGLSDAFRELSDATTQSNQRLRRLNTTVGSLNAIEQRTNALRDLNEQYREIANIRFTEEGAVFGVEAPSFGQRFLDVINIFQDIRRTESFARNAIRANIEELDELQQRQERINAVGIRVLRREELDATTQQLRSLNEEIRTSQEEFQRLSEGGRTQDAPRLAELAGQLSELRQSASDLEPVYQRLLDQLNDTNVPNTVEQLDLNIASLDERIDGLFERIGNIGDPGALRQHLDFTTRIIERYRDLRLQQEDLSDLDIFTINREARNDIRRLEQAIGRRLEQIRSLRRQLRDANINLSSVITEGRVAEQQIIIDRLQREQDATARELSRLRARGAAQRALGEQILEDSITRLQDELQDVRPGGRNTQDVIAEVRRRARSIDDLLRIQTVEIDPSITDPETRQAIQEQFDRQILQRRIDNATRAQQIVDDLRRSSAESQQRIAELEIQTDIDASETRIRLSRRTTDIIANTYRLLVDRNRLANSQITAIIQDQLLTQEQQAARIAEVQSGLSDDVYSDITSGLGSVVDNFTSANLESNSFFANLLRNLREARLAIDEFGELLRQNIGVQAEQERLQRSINRRRGPSILGFGVDTSALSDIDALIELQQSRALTGRRLTDNQRETIRASFARQRDAQRRDFFGGQFDALERGISPFTDAFGQLGRIGIGRVQQAIDTNRELERLERDTAERIQEVRDEETLSYADQQEEILEITREAAQERREIERQTSEDLRSQFLNVGLSFAQALQQQLLDYAAYQARITFINASAQGAGFGGAALAGLGAAGLPLAGVAGIALAGYGIAQLLRSRRFHDPINDALARQGGRDILRDIQRNERQSTRDQISEVRQGITDEIASSGGGSPVIQVTGVDILSDEHLENIFVRADELVANGVIVRRG